MCFKGIYTIITGKSWMRQKPNRTMAHQIMLIPKPTLKHMWVQKSLTLSCNVKNALKYWKITEMQFIFERYIYHTNAYIKIYVKYFLSYTQYFLSGYTQYFLSRYFLSVPRSSTPSTKQKLNQLKLFFPKRKSYIPTIPKEWNQKNVFFLIFLKLGIYIMWTLISCNMLITTSVHHKFENVITS